MKQEVNIIGLIGRTNSGKSTLLNNLLNKKIAATANRVNTTRIPLTGVYRFQDKTGLLLDSPGLLRVKTLLDRFVGENLQVVLNHSQILGGIMDVNDVGHRDNEQLAELLEKHQKPTLLLINKIDLVKKEKVMAKITQGQKKFSFTEIIPISAKNKIHFEQLLEISAKHLSETGTLPISPQQFSLNSYLDIAKEIIREQVIYQTREELTHQTEIVLRTKYVTDTSIRLAFDVIVATASQKGIILGKGGNKIKTIRQHSQQILMKLGKKKLQLFLQVKVIENGYQKPKILKELNLTGKGLTS